MPTDQAHLAYLFDELNRRIGEREHATLALAAITHFTDPAVTDLTLALKVLAVLVGDTMERDR